MWIAIAIVVVGIVGWIAWLEHRMHDRHDWLVFGVHGAVTKAEADVILQMFNAGIIGDVEAKQMLGVSE